MEPSPTMNMPKATLFAHGVGIGVFAALKGLGAMFPLFVVAIFAHPAAILTSLFMGAPIETTPDGEAVLFYRGIEVLVSGACSGFGFFSLSCALFVGFAVTRFRERQWLVDFPAGLLLVFGLTIFTNSIRMACAVQIRLLSSRLFPESYDVAIHMAVGMIVFIPVLLLSWNLLHRTYEPK